MSDRGSVYYSYVEKWLESEHARRSRLESRASSVVTSSAALVSLTFGLVAVIIGQDYTFTTGARAFVIVAMALFVLAGLSALAAGQLRRYRVPGETDLRAALSEHWTDSQADARLAGAWMDLNALLTLRAGSNRGAWWLDRALQLQFLAMLTLGVAVTWELVRRF